jgi:hypothetical protein
MDRASELRESAGMKRQRPLPIRQLEMMYDDGMSEEDAQEFIDSLSS